MSELVPTVITDKNGKVTVVHRRRDSERKSPISPISPIPTVKAGRQPVKQQDVAVVEELVNALGLRMQYVSAKVKENITSLSDDDVAILREALSSAPPKVMAPEEFQSAMVHPMNTDDGKAGRHMRNTLVLLESELPVYRHQQLLVMLGKHKDFREASYDLYAADKESKKMVLGIANAIHSLRSQETVIQDKYGNETIKPLINTLGKSLRLTDPTLLPAMLENPEHAEAIAALYIERGNIDALDEVINSSTAIRDGAL